MARDLFRESFRAHAREIERYHYDCGHLAGLLLATAHDSLLDDLIDRPLVDGDLLATANTLIYMGKLREGNHFARGLFIAKHRGSACSDEIIRYTINDRGLALG